jgi:ABC-2 type transport system ATP-binding protein
LIEVSDLTKYYGPKKAIENVTFEVDRGEILGFLGPNAAGKTTTMRILTCFMPATSGTARVAGYDVFEDSREVRRRIGYLPEIPPLYKEMSVDYFLNFVACIKELDTAMKMRRIGEVIERCGLNSVKGEIIGRLSKGFRQRVGLAQALVHDPEVLILDEPTIGLDPKQIIEVRQLIKDLGEDRTVILSTHILPEVSMTCGRVVIINEGKITAVDTPENLTRKLKDSDRIHVEVTGPQEDVVAEIRNLNGIKGIQVIPSKEEDRKLVLEVESESGQDICKDIASAVVGKGWDLHGLRPVSMTLEEVFLKLTTREEGTV